MSVSKRDAPIQATLRYVLLCGVLVSLSGCYIRFNETSSPYRPYVGSRAEVQKQIDVYDQGWLGGTMGIPAGAWAMNPEKRIETILPGSTIHIIGVSSRRIDSGKHYYLAAKYEVSGRTVNFDYPAEEKWLADEYLKFTPKPSCKAGASSSVQP